MTEARKMHIVDKRVMLTKEERPLEFQVEHVIFLKMAPLKGVMRFRKKGKLIPRFIGPFEIIERIRKVAYKLALSPRLYLVQ